LLVQIDENLKAMHQLQSEDAQEASLSGQRQPATGSAGQVPPLAAVDVQQSSGSGGGVAGLVAVWLRAAAAGVFGIVAQLESAFFHLCRRREWDAWVRCVQEHKNNISKSMIRKVGGELHALSYA
jgi:hypothetical protein